MQTKMPFKTPYRLLRHALQSSRPEMFGMQTSSTYFTSLRRTLQLPLTIMRDGKQKDRITVLVFASVAGVQKLPLMFVRTSLRPRGFKGKTGTEYGLTYVATKNTLMTGDLFIDWLKRFNKYFQRRELHFLLLVNICGAHGCQETLTLLYHVEIVFCPR